MDERTRKYLASEVARWIRSQESSLRSHADDALWRAAIHNEYNGAETTAGAVMRWPTDQNIGTVFIAIGRSWQNGHVESFHGKLPDECLNRE